MGKLADIPPGYRAPGSDLIVRRLLGVLQFSPTNRGQAAETVCIRPRPDRANEPCGNVRTVLIKRLTGAKAITACEECARLKQWEGRKAALKAAKPAPARVSITPRNYTQFRAELERAAGAAWAEFCEMQVRRQKNGGWNMTAEIEALKICALRRD